MKKCKQCKKKIDEKEKYVDLATLNIRGKKDHHDYFHFGCWMNYFNEEVKRKAEAMTNVENIVDNTLKSPKIKKTLSGLLKPFMKKK